MTDYRKFDKVVPRLNNYDYRTHNYALYVYLDPFVEWKKSYRVGKNNVFFYYMPIYVGKLESPLAYRMNQHWNLFKKGQQDSKNPYKKEYFQEIMKKMDHEREQPAPDPYMPKNWEDYKKGWIIIQKTFKNREDLRKYESQMISAIGIRRDNTGPLVNVRREKK